MNPNTDAYAAGLKSLGVKMWTAGDHPIPVIPAANALAGGGERDSPSRGGRIGGNGVKGGKRVKSGGGGVPEDGAERKRRKKEIKALTRRAGALVDKANGEEKGGAARKKFLQRASVLFDQAIAVGPVDGKFDARLHNNAGVVLVRRENPGDALRHYQRALALYPGYESAIGNAAEARAMLHAMHRGEL